MKNRALHHGIKCSPYEAMFGQPMKVGLKTSNFPDNLVSTLNSEEELEALIQTVTSQKEGGVSGDEVQVGERAQEEVRHDEVQVDEEEQHEVRQVEIQVAEVAQDEVQVNDGVQVEVHQDEVQVTKETPDVVQVNEGALNENR